VAAPIIEQIAANLLAACQGINGSAPYTNALTVIRPAMEPASPADKLVVMIQGKPQEMPDVWGIKKRKLWFTFVFYARPAQRSNSGAVDSYLNSIASDLETAIMTDPRRGGLVDVDTVVGDPMFYEGTSPGLLVGFLPVSQVSRVLRSDPTVKAPAAGNESFWQGGAVLHYARYTGPRTLGAWRRWADLKIAPSGASKTDAMNSDRDGIVRPRAVKMIAWSQKYTIETNDFSPQAMALAMGASDVQAFSQAGTMLSGIALPCAGPDSVMPLTDAAGDPLWNVQSVQAVTSADGSITYAAGTDYVADPQAMREGLLEIPAASSIPAGAVLVTMTPAAISGQRLLTAQESGDIRYRARILWPAANGMQMQVHGPLDAAIVPKQQTRDAADYSCQKFDLIVLDDGSDLPAGQLVLPLGPIPAAGY
jgi:hypothetical protein